MAAIRLTGINKQRGRYVKKDVLEPVGVCDYSGFFFSKSDLVRQMEWRGDELVWTGFMVGRPFVDKPSQQNRPPIVKDDPAAVRNPRPLGLYTPVGDDVNPSELTNDVENILSSVDFYPNKKDEFELTEEFSRTLFDFAGEDISDLNEEERLIELNNIKMVN